jgi:cation transport regulator ChaC
MRKLVLLLALATSLALHAQVYVYPPGPDSETPVQIGADLWCAVHSASVTVGTSVIQVRHDATFCGSPPFSIPFSVPVPQLLAPGTYQIVVAGAEEFPAEFIVRDANPRFAVHPYAIPTKVDPGFKVYIVNAAAECANRDCAIRVGSDPMLITPRVEGEHLVFDAPRRNATGETHVTIVRNNADIFLRGALAYYDTTKPPDPSIFERILIPLLFNTKGANGSDWRSELTALNPAPWTIQSYNDLGTIVSPCLEGPCGERLGPGELLKLDGGNFANGHLFLVPRNDADGVAFSLRVRDVSRVAEGFGTEIPVVRERDFFRNQRISLLDVPVDPRYRARLRVYSLEPFPNSYPAVANVLITYADGSESESTIMLARPCHGDACDKPAFGEIDLRAGAGEAVDVSVAGPHDSPTWAFISVTNNETQQVTLVLPDGAGGTAIEHETSSGPQDFSITTIPEHPKAGDDVILSVAGNCLMDGIVERTGNVLRIQANVGICDPPLGTELRIETAELPPGRYDVILTRPDDARVLATSEFTVLPHTGWPFAVHPFAVPSTSLAPPEIRIDKLPFPLPCPECKITLDGVPVTPRYEDGALYVIAPPRPAGNADIRIERGSEELVLRGAIYYYDLDAAPDTALFERILFPVLFNAPGANNSLWLSETTMLNLRAWAIETLNNIVPGQCIDYPCFERIAAHERLTFTGGDHPNGVALLTPREDADDVVFSLRARDVSRAAEGLGTAIPVVREKDMFRNTDLTLLDVPVDARYRVKLRVYAFDESASAATLVTHDPATNARTRTPLALTRTCNNPRSCAAAPAVAVADLPAGANGARVNLYVEMPDRALAWAFATVTNNSTQQVTIVTADGTGGEVCSGCTMP